MSGRVLVAGVGNIFLGDDGFGVEVARRLAAADLPSWVRVADYGISGMHLAYDLADGYETAILVDAAPRGGEPGTVTVVEAEAPPREREPWQPAAGDGLSVEQPCGGREPGAGLVESRLFDAHGMQPEVVLGMLDMLGASSARVLVVGCEPASLEPGMELSEPVARAVDEAVRVVMDLVAQQPVTKE
jgi:hydrogenase maturation protease